MSGSHLRVELRSPKRGLDGGYGFDLTKYCANCWSRLGRILKRGARCGVCGRRVCKGCRHFVAAKEWICVLCYKKRYAPEDSWHDDANTKQFKGSQGKSGTYLLRLTDWSAHGVLEVHKVKDLHPGRIRTFSNEPFPPFGYSFKNRLYKRNLHSKPHDPVRHFFNYPLVQHDIQLKRWKTLDDAMNPQNHKENHLKYTSVNLKQKRKEMREHRAMSFGKGRHQGGTPDDFMKKKSSFNRINSIKRERLQPAKTLFHDYDFPLTSSVRRSRSNSNSSANASWQKEYRRSRRNGSHFSHPAVFYEDEPHHMRLSVRGTRIFGRRKSYRAYPSLKGDARANSSAIKSRSSSLPCELSNVESPDYEFWNSGFVQTRVRKLEEELTSKCDDKYSYSHDYEIQSLCSLKLDKILPDGDDYRIAYLSSTSQESSLDYMDDSYCSIGMGTLDVKLNKKCLLPGNEDWDLTFSSNEENDSSDDDEFFYQKYNNMENDSFQSRNYYSRNISILDDCKDIQHSSIQGKKCSNNLGVESLDDSPKSITQQIHERVDRIFNDVMNYDLDFTNLPDDKLNNEITLDQPCFQSSNEEALNLIRNEEVRGDLANFNSNYILDKSFSLKNIYGKQNDDNSELDSSLESILLPVPPDYLKNQIPQKDSKLDDTSDCATLSSKSKFPAANVSSCPPIATDRFTESSKQKYTSTIDSQQIHKNTSNISIFNCLLGEKDINNLQNEIGRSKKIDCTSKCLNSETDLYNQEKQKQIETCSVPDFSQFESSGLQLMGVTHNVAPKNYSHNSSVSGLLNSMIVESNYSKDKLNEETYPCLSSSDFKVVSNIFFDNQNTDCEEQRIDSNKNRKNENLQLCSKSEIKNHLIHDVKKRKNKTEKSILKTNSFLEVELIFYEPLCTPFAEIYFITYGKKYPTKCCNKSRMQRKMMSDMGNEFTVNLINERVILTCKNLLSSKRIMQLINNFAYGKIFKKQNDDKHKNEKRKRIRYYNGDFIKQNSENYPVMKSFEYEKYESDESDLQGITAFAHNRKLFLKFIHPLYKIKEIHFPNFFLENCLSALLNLENAFYQHCSANERQFTVFNKNEVPAKAVRFGYFSVRENSSLYNYFYSESTDKFILVILEPVTNFRIFLNEIKLLENNCLFLIDEKAPFSHQIKWQKENPPDNKFKFSKTIFCTSKISRNTSKISENFKRKSLRSKCLLKSGLKINFHKNFYKITKNKNSNVWTVKFHSIRRLERNNTFLSRRKKYLIFKALETYQHMARNRNYGNSYSTQGETEITNEVPHVGEISESRFVVGSQLKPTTSRSGNATFVKYLFLPQLASVRDSTEAHLSVSSFQLRFQSVPAVQRRLVDRESRFIQSGKDRKHGSLCAATTANGAADVTGRDCIRSAQDICTSENSALGYTFHPDCFDTARITSRDHDFQDYVCFGSVPTGLQVISNPVIVDGINLDNFNPTSVLYHLQQNMATCDEDPRLINKVTRTPGRNISKLKKFFDTRESVSGDLDTTFTKKVEITPPSSHSHDVNNTTDISSTMECNSESSQRILNGYNETNIVRNENLVEGPSENVSYNSNQVSSSNIPFCRKVSGGGDLWKNVDIGVKTSSDGLWDNAQINDSNPDNIPMELRQAPNSFVSSTEDLHNLIAASRAELSKKKEPLLSDKSTLENYFTSFENSKPKNYTPLNSTDHSDFSNDSTNFLFSDCETFKSSAVFDCEIDEMNFDEEDVTLSDTSSDEEIRCNPAINTHYLPAYSLHTIIEESCEESERDSRTATPTNDPVTSKLERYFSWDIINDAETGVKRKDDDDSTVFSDSLSEVSGSLNGDNGKEIDPTQLASSRLEKYFTSGLVGNENYFYPDDAEFLEDAPVSDFEEDSIHQKISRSALLSSLESVSEQQTTSDELLELKENEQTFTNIDYEIANQQSCDETVTVIDADVNSDESYCKSDKVIEIDSFNLKSCNNNCDIRKDNEIVKEEAKESETTGIVKVSSNNDVSSSIKESEINNVESEIIENDDTLIHKQNVNKEQLAVDVQAIIKKLLAYFSGSGSTSFKHNVETNYVSAWQILETEIERLIQSISPTASVENNSCNSSTIDSNNSDYGSDTIESLECMTDEDEVSDAKNRNNAKYPIVDLLSAAYKIPDFPNVNISNETLSIWKRLIQSLQKDSFCINDNKLCDPNTEARLYIRDQIVNLMHTVTVNENKIDSEIAHGVIDAQEKEISSSLIEENDRPEDINEAFNVSISGAGLLTYSEEENIVPTKLESSDEGISVENSEILKTSETNTELTESQIFCNLNNVEIKSDLNESLTTVLNDSIHLDDNNVLLSTYLLPEKINVDEIDFKLNDSSIKRSKDNNNAPNVPLFVNIEIDDKISTVIGERNDISQDIKNDDVDEGAIKRSSLHLWVSGETESIDKDAVSTEDLPYLSYKENSHVLPDEISNNELNENFNHTACESSDIKITQKSYRDTGYYSFKSSDDNFLNETPPPDEFMDVPDFKSLKRSVKKFPLSNTLSKSTNNINQVLSVPDTKFSTLQLKSQKSKGASSSNSSSSRKFTSLFSPTAVFKKLTGSKGNDTQTPDSSIPAKYLKKYARSSSVESESIIGALSMPQLNYPKSSDSYSALGLYSENDRDSSLMTDDDMDVKKHPAYSHSVLSLGSHSASMTSVYSASACHYGYVTVSGDVLFGLNYNQKSQMLDVFVKQCRNLAAVDTRRNKSDPYVKVYLLPDKTKGGKRKTKIKKNTLNPVFNELLRFPVLKHELESRTLWLSVWNSDLFGHNDFLGEISLPLGYRLLDSTTLRWYPLQEREVESLTSPLNYRGELFLALKYVPRDLSLESRFRPAPVISLRGALHVLVKEARNISVNRSGNNLAAFCKSYLLPDKSKSSKQKTPVVKKSQHPKWYYTVIYEDLSVDELREHSLELTVWDHDRITSNEFMGGVRLNIGSGLYHGVSVEWMDARRDEAALWKAMLESPNMWVDGCLPLRPTMQFHH